MDGREIIQNYFKGKIVKNNSNCPKFPKVDGTQRVTVFTKQTGVFKKKRYHIAWLEPDKVIPFTWGFVSIYEDGVWSRPEPLKHSEIVDVI